MNRIKLGEINGTPIESVELSNDKLSVTILTYGGTIQKMVVFLPDGQKRDLVLGFDNWEDYVDQGFYLGCLIGRVSNRITGAKFTLNGTEYALEANEGDNHLHGGSKGLWNIPMIIKAIGEEFVTLRHISPDGAGGYPGELTMDVTYSISEGKLTLDYTASSDKDTIISLTNHSYFNLESDHFGTVLDEMLVLYASRYAQINELCASTGNILDVNNTAFDFTTPAKIGDRVFVEEEQMVKGTGLNHNFIPDKKEGEFAPVAKLISSDEKVSLTVSSDQPGMQVYSGNYLDESLKGKDGAHYKAYSAICFETQNYPDAVNISSFPSPVIKAGELYHTRTTFEIKTK